MKLTTADIQDLAELLETRAMDFEDSGLSAWARESARFSGRLRALARLLVADEQHGGARSERTAAGRS